MMVNQNKSLLYVIHIAAWGIVFCFPLFFLWKGGNAVTWEKFIGYSPVFCSFVAVFYVNYFVLIDKLLFRKKLVQFIAANMVFFIILSVALDLWQGYYFTNIETDVHEHRPGPPKMMFILRDCMMMSLTAALSVAIRMTGNWYQVENEKKELEKARSEAELQNLKNQLNPHFLFNTLNNIYSLIAIDPDRAQYAVHDLSRLLRHVLYEDNQKFVLLQEELVFMKSYIELMSLRLSGKVDLQVNMPEDGRGMEVAPLLFITLIENAFKHGVSPVKPSFIHIGFTLDGTTGISCCIENSFFPKNEEDKSGSGIGLENLRKRLELLYPGRYMLITERKGDKYVAELNLRLP